MDWSTQSYTSSFAYVEQVEVFSVSPAHGPIKGGTEVIVRGKNFVKTSQLTCNFGTDSVRKVPATHWFNSTTIICISPPGEVDADTKDVAFTVSNTGATTGSDVSTNVVYYTYDPIVIITSVFPPLGPTSGNISVRISGGPFFETYELRCRFGSIAVLAIYVGNGEMNCYAPPHPPGIYPIEVGTNDQDYTTQRYPFFYYADQTLSRISPVSGPAIVADTKVSVYGSGFVNSTYLTCRFGYTKSFGVFVSSNHITCPSPALDGVFKNGSDGLSGGLQYLALSEQFNRLEDPIYYGKELSGPRTRLFPGSHYYPLFSLRLTTFEVSNNNQDFTDSGIGFLYQADAVINSISPSSGQVNVRTPIVITGNHFVNSTLLRCRVGVEISVPTFLSR